MPSSGLFVASAVSAVVILLITVNYSNAENCNEAVCASLVTKCMLLKSCECDMTDARNCTCCKDCQRCLQSLYTECCSCVGKEPVTSNKSILYRTVYRAIVTRILQHCWVYCDFIFEYLKHSILT